MPPPTTIAVLAAARHPRLRYVLKEVGKDLGVRLQLFTDADKWGSSPTPFRFCYSRSEVDRACPVLPSSQFLFGKPVTQSALVVSWEGQLPRFFSLASRGNHQFSLSYDPLACIFYCLSRYEEYEASVERDRHGRFLSTSSHAKVNGYLELPVVRMWVSELANVLKEAFSDLPPFQRRPFRFQPTYDIDLLWAYSHRGWKGVASGVRDLVTGKADRTLLRVTTDAAGDPYNVLHDLLTWHQRQRPGPTVKPYVFWLLADNADRRDTNPFPIPEEQAELMRALDGEVWHGLHPSYQSMDDPTLTAVEADRFREIMGRPPQHGRQHFLRFALPNTYRELLLNGIRNDHSMGYADAAGWRAGTNLPFNWYDLDREERTGLVVHPFAAMEVTLKNYEKLDAPAAQLRILKLAADLHPYGGPFTLLWHNSSFAPEHGWGGWKEMYLELLGRLAALEEKSFISSQTDPSPPGNG